MFRDTDIQEAPPEPRRQFNRRKWKEVNEKRKREHRGKGKKRNRGI
jgi:hypothetical protein